MPALRELAAPFVVPGPAGVAIRTRLKGLTTEDEKVLRLVGDHLGSLASRDLKARCAAGQDHDSEQQDPQDHPPPRSRSGDRKARPGAPDPATDGTAPCSPE